MNKEILTNIIMVVVSVLLTVFLAEVVYRGKLHYFNKSFGASTYMVITEPRGIYSEEFGIEYIPGSQANVLKVNDGKVTWCPEGPLSITNKDGLNGISTYDDYGQAQYKIAVFGDSFTHWNQQGETWPDALQRELSNTASSNVVALNYGRGAYGVLQMLDLAGQMVPRVKPDLTIIAFISDDLKRDRWWSITDVVDGIQREFISPDKKNMFNVSSASDRWIIEPNASSSWCDRALKGSSHDPILSSIKDKYARIKYSSGKGVYSLTSITDIYLLNRLIYGSPFPNRIRPSIPLHSYDDFSNDSQTMKNVKNIVESSGEILLIHLPLKGEIIAGHYLSQSGNLSRASLKNAPDMAK